MAYDLKLADRLRRLLAGHKGVTEKAMFGGLAFLKDGKMFCGVSGDELLARVGPDAHEAAMARKHVRIMDFTGRPMRGYVFVGPAAIASDAGLAPWVDGCEVHVAALPDKPKKKAKAPAPAGARSPVSKSRKGSVGRRRP
jgi:hypothetical protein